VGSGDAHDVAAAGGSNDGSGDFTASQEAGDDHFTREEDKLGPLKNAGSLHRSISLGTLFPTINHPPLNTMGSLDVGGFSSPPFFRVEDHGQGEGRSSDEGGRASHHRPSSITV
jgi:hypothetical protein